MVILSMETVEKLKKQKKVTMEFNPFPTGDEEHNHCYYLWADNQRWN